MATNEKVDVAIVGAGASGSVFAAVLAKAGKKVVMLESGPDWKLSDLISSDFWGRRLKAAGAPFLLEGKNPFGYGFQSGWGVGGAALHYFANFPRLLPNDFKIKSEHGRALDWPISYQDVGPYYDKTARDLGVSGDAKAEEIWRPAGAPYPMPPMKTFRHGEIWLKGFEAAGIRMVPASVGMNSTEYNGRPACIYDGWCHVGCPTGALANPQVTYLADARKAGAEVRPRSTVTRVRTNPQGTKVTAVEYYDEKREHQVQEASTVVLAAWSSQNPRIMLNSATDKHPRGSPIPAACSANISCATSARALDAIFDEDVQNYMGTTGSQFMSYDRYGKTSHKGVFGSTFIVAGSALKTSDLRVSPMRASTCSAPTCTRSCGGRRAGTPESAHSAKNCRTSKTASSSQAKRTSSGCRWAGSFTASTRMRRTVERQFRGRSQDRQGAGAKEAWSARGNQPTIHLMGGTIMGMEAGTSVVNSYGQSHEIPNLYVAGPGIFPTGGASNPTYTIFALSLRGAEHLATNWSTIAG